MIVPFNMSRFIDLFIDESRETLEKIEKLLLAFEQNSAVTAEEINDLFRYLHTLKGNSSSIGFLYFSKLAHELEHFLDAMRHETLIYSTEIGESLIEGYELLNEILTLEIAKEINEELFQNKCAPHLKNLSAYLNSDTQKDTIVVPNESPLRSREGETFGFFKKVLKTQNSPTLLENEPKVAPKNSLLFEEQPKEAPKESRSVGNASIRVNLEKIDNLMNGIGELVIAMSMLEQYADNLTDQKIKNGFNERIGFLQHTIRDLQDSVMSTRMVPMEQVYSKFPKVIRDIAKTLHKEILFKTSGSEVEIDKAMIEGLSDPLMHIIRNACDHGIESSEQRLRLGKPIEGTIKIEATQANEQIVISIYDDGKGIDTEKVVEKAISMGILSKERAITLSHKEKINLIFEPGFTTTTDITDLSGRGVGMDVVRSNISHLGGTIQIDSTLGEGSLFRLLLPLTLAIVDVLTVVIGNSHFFLPLSVIIESLQPEMSMIQSMGNKNNEVLVLREEAIPIIRLHDIFKIETSVKSLSEGMLIIVRYGTSKVAIFIDIFLNQQQVVIKPIDKNFKAIKGFSGASIKGDGSIALILDVVAITAIYKHNKGIG
ncbi:MAG: chemotaxis protein CheA [Campylobacterales bacterium]|nr:chemotaxis protein CheA [Campylobacterales bacterium]